MEAGGNFITPGEFRVITSTTLKEWMRFGGSISAPSRDVRKHQGPDCADLPPVGFDRVVSCLDSRGGVPARRRRPDRRRRRDEVATTQTSASPVSTYSVEIPTDEPSEKTKIRPLLFPGKGGWEVFNSPFICRFIIIRGVGGRYKGGYFKGSLYWWA